MVPNQYGTDREDMEKEINNINNLLIKRKNPQNNPQPSQFDTQQPFNNGQTLFYNPPNL